MSKSRRARAKTRRQPASAVPVPPPQPATLSTDTEASRLATARRRAQRRSSGSARLRSSPSAPRWRSRASPTPATPSSPSGALDPAAALSRRSAEPPPGRGFSRPQQRRLTPRRARPEPMREQHGFARWGATSSSRARLASERESDRAPVRRTRPSLQPLPRRQRAQSRQRRSRTTVRVSHGVRRHARRRTRSRARDRRPRRSDVRRGARGGRLRRDFALLARRTRARPSAPAPAAVVVRLDRRTVGPRPPACTST